MANERYTAQVQLLMRTIPLVAEEEIFALKGGTAINLFVRDLPRLSVDIDLTYLPIQSREDSLAAIDAGLRRIAARIEETIKGTRVTPVVTGGAVIKLNIQQARTIIKIEVTPVLRGCVFPPEARSVSPAVEERFGYAEMPVVSFADLYAGKIVAALDRQHPRDLFDVKQLLAAEGIDDDLRLAFLVYLTSHHRPMHEVLAPARKDIAAAYAREFEGMTIEPVPLDELIAAREDVIAAMVTDMPDEHRAFLISFELGEPGWELLELPDVQNLPAVRWRQQNLNSLDKAKRANLVAKLGAVWGLIV
jgi:predicted nucleotidyltransferase component of viral defense system